MSAKKKKEPNLRNTKAPSPSLLSRTQKAKPKVQRSATEQSISRALTAAQVGAFEWDIETGELWLSDSMAEIFDLPIKNLPTTYNALIRLLPKEDKKLLPQKIKKLLANQGAQSAERRLTRSDGMVRWVEMHARVFRNEKKKPIKLSGIIRDVSEIKLTAIEKRDWESRYKVLAACLNQVIYDYNLKTEEIQWGGTIQSVLGYDPEEIATSAAWLKLIHREDRKEAMEKLDISRRGLKPYDVRYRFKTGHKSYVNIHDRGIFLADENGQAFRMVGSMQDITEIVRIEEQLRESNRLKESMESAMPGLLYVYDLQTKKNIYVNHNITRTLGYTWEEIEEIGNDITGQLIHPDDVSYLTSWSDESSRTVKESEYRLRTRSGEWRWFRSRDSVFQRDEKGKVTQIIGVAQDITERKKVEEELRESEERFRTLQEASFGGIAMHNKGVIIDCNHGLSNITGFTREELIGMNGLNLIAPEFQETVYQNIVTGYDKPYDVEGVNKDGNRYSLEISGKNIPYKGGEIRVTEFRNITPRKIIEEKILEQNARLQSITIDLQRKNEQLEEFTQIVSHNLRSPIGNILTLLSFMESSTSEADKAQFLKFLKESSTNALNTLEELNEVLKLKQNKNIEKQVLDFESVCSHVKTMISATIAETGAEISCDFSEAPSITYPHIYLESILLNLLSNALRYSKPDEKPVVEVRSYYEQQNLLLMVKDNGRGINLERYGHQIFKLHKTFHRHPESRGIGLFMIKNQIEAMGGEISIESQEDVGTTFFINFNKHHTYED